MIIDYDQNPNLTTDEKLKSLKESVQRALDSLSPGSKVVIHQGGGGGGVSPSSTTPKMDGTASPGSENAYARGDHIHPTDTSRASASDLTTLTTTVAGKVDKVTGKGLSTEDYTSAEKTKLSGIESGAEANVQSDWNEADSTDDAYIKNKPSLATVATSGSYNDLLNKPTIPAAQIQSDWNQSDNTALDYIKNKPTIPPGVVVDSSMSDSSENAVQNKVIKNYVDSNIPTVPQWTLAGTATGQSWVTGIPTTAKEVYIEVYTGNHTAMYSGVYLRDSMTTGVLNIGGYYISSSDYGLCNVNIANNGREVQIRNHRYGGTNYTTTATIRVFYR